MAKNNFNLDEHGNIDEKAIIGEREKIKRKRRAKHFIKYLFLYFILPIAVITLIFLCLTRGFIVVNNTLIKYIGFSEEVKIPQRVLFQEVNSIGDNVFRGDKYIRGVIIPSTVKSIGSYSFMDCKYLEDVTFKGRSLDSISNSAFSNCTALVSITLPRDTGYIGPSAFYGCIKLQNVVFPQNGYFAVIEPLTFAFCRKLEEITIPDSIHYIGREAFSNCSNLKTITIPDNTLVDHFVFGSGTTSLDNINYKNSAVTDEFIIIDGYIALYKVNDVSKTDEKQTESVSESNAKKENRMPLSINGKYFYHDGTVKVFGIGEKVFAGHGEITEVVIGGTITEVRRGAFENCANLKSITFFDSVKEIKSDVLLGCTKLESVFISSVANVNSELFGADNIKNFAFVNNLNPYSLKYTGFDNDMAFVNGTLLKYDGDSPIVYLYGEIVSNDRNPVAVNGMIRHLTAIGSYAFSSGTAENITVNGKIKEIMSNAFSNAGHLKMVDLNYGVEKISGDAFSGDCSIDEINFPPTINQVTGSGNLEMRSVKRGEKITVRCVEGSFIHKFIDENYSIDEVNFVFVATDYYAVQIQDLNKAAPEDQAKFTELMRNYVVNDPFLNKSIIPIVLPEPAVAANVEKSATNAEKKSGDNQ